MECRPKNFRQQQANGMPDFYIGIRQMQAHNGLILVPAREAFHRRVTGKINHPGGAQVVVIMHL